jgi:hypothetical protein
VLIVTVPKLVKQGKAGRKAHQSRSKADRLGHQIR